jgi:hypothetical protein
MEHKGVEPRLVLSCARRESAHSRVYKRPRGRERERDGASERARSSARRFSRATLSREGPGPSFYRCKERVQVYKWGVAMC